MFNFNCRFFGFSLDKRLLAVLGGVLVFVIAGASSNSCQSDTSNSTESTTQASQQDIYNTNGQQLPTFPYSNYRQSLLQIQQQLATGDVTTWTTWETNSGADKHVCKSFGYPIPVTAQLSNPSQIDFKNWPNGGGAVDGIVGQMDPTGIYTGPNGLGTWILCLDPSGTPHASYIENNVEAYPYPVTLENGNFVEHPEQATTATAIHPCKYDARTKKCQPVG
jgi:hypothetical protein